MVYKNLTPGARELLRECLTTWIGPAISLHAMTFGHAAAILQAARRIAVTETNPTEWEIEVLYQLKRLLAR